MENPSEAVVRKTGLDFLRGALMICVIVGHVFSFSLGYVWTNPVRYFIYSFHMPLFFAISGFLVNHRYVKEASMRAFFSKYTKRLAIPLVFAWFFWFFFVKQQYLGILSSETLLQLVLPQNFLWYGVCLLSYLLAYRLFSRLSSRLFLLLGISLIVAACSVLFIDILPDESIFGIMLDKFFYSYRPHYFCFFVLGMIIRERDQEPRHERVLLGLLVVVICIRAGMFVNNMFYPIGFDFFILNFLLILYLIPKSRMASIESKNFISRIGRNSLPLYLYHIILISTYGFSAFTIGWYFLVFSLEAMLIVLVCYRSVVSKYLLGPA